MKKCLACGTERDLADGNNPESCPKCERVYVKIEAILRARKEAQTRVEVQSKRTVEAVKQQSLTEEHRSKPASEKTPRTPTDVGDNVETRVEKLKIFWSGLGETKRILICVVLAFMVGFFAGREHLKYQIAEGFREVAESIGSIFSGSLKTPQSKSSEPQKEKIKEALREELVTAVMINKDYFEGKYGQDKVTFEMQFENRTKRDIRGFNGIVFVEDILGNAIKQLNVRITDPIIAGSSITWSGAMSFNQFIDSDRALKNSELEDIVTKFEVTKVLYQDGEVLEFK